MTTHHSAEAGWADMNGPDTIGTAETGTGTGTGRADAHGRGASRVPEPWAVSIYSVIADANGGLLRVPTRR